jgi:[ribosomal protein S18]-alanine N-acetyltransferase
MSMLVLRQMHALDVEPVMEIERRIHPHPWTHGNFTDALDSRYIGKVAELDGNMIGYAVLMPAMDEAHLLNIGIDAKYQGKGLGSELLQKMLELARETGIRRIILEVRPSNTAAMALYSKGGFREIGIRRGYYAAASGREDAIVMELEL